MSITTQPAPGRSPAVQPTGAHHVAREQVARRRSTNAGLIAFLLAPSFLVMGFIFLYPLVYNFVISLHDATLLRPNWIWEGLGNYQRIFEGADFWAAAQITLIWTFGSVTLQFLVGLAFALALHEEFPGRAIFRAILVLPWITPGIIVAILFSWMYNPQYGLLNYFLVQVGIIDQFVPWLASADLALPAVIAANVWNGFPFHMLMLLAGLQAIPDDLHQAASVDGATYLQRLRYITLPLIKPVAMTVLLLATIWTTNFFTLIYGMTAGGPAKATTTFSILIYRSAFTYMQLGQAAAMAVMVFVVMSVLSLLYIRSTRHSFTEGA